MGIGSSLMKLALHQAKENGLEQMELGVYAEMNGQSICIRSMDLSSAESGRMRSN